MKRRFSLPFSLILFIGGLVFGIRLGIFIAGDEPFNLFPPLGEPQTPTPVIPGQNSLLIIGVDRLNSPPASLQGAWYVAYVPDNPVITLIPLYPNIDKNFNERLEGSFDLQHSNRLSREFTAILEDTYNFDWDTQILLDDFAMIDFIDLLGGVELDGELQTGSQVVGGIPRASSNPQKALDGQIAVVQSLCERTNLLKTPLDLSEITTKFTPHLVMQVDLAEAYHAFSELLASEPTLTCNLVDFRSN